MESTSTPSRYPAGRPVRLRAALLGHTLSPSARGDILALSGARPTRFIVELIINWLVIAALVALGSQSDSVILSVCCIILIGTRQSVFALLLHEQVHRLGLRTKHADWIVNVLAVFPLLVTTVEDYAKVHLSHHKYFFTARDPDFVRKSGDEWTFPKPMGSMVAMVARDVTAMNLWRLIKGKTAPKTDEFTRRHPTPVWLRIGFFLVLVATLTFLGGWTTFLLYWIAPLLTVAQLMIRWIAVAEHEYNVEGSVLETTPIIQLTWWQRVVFPDLNFGYHIYHHMHPGVSFSELPKVHAIYKNEGLVDESAIFKGQGAYLKYLIGRG